MHNQYLSIDQSKEAFGLRSKSAPEFCFTSSSADAETLVGTMIDFSGIVLASDEIVEFLKHELQVRSVCQRILHQRIIGQAAGDRSLGVAPLEIQAEADRVRYELRLESAARTQDWLKEQLITPEDWEAGIYDRLLSQKLREALFAQDVERSFIQSRLDFEQISLYRIRVPYHPLAQELFYQIEESEISFYEAAHLYDIDEQRRLRCGYDGRLHRWDLEPDIAATLFGANVGEILGPFAMNPGYDLLMVGEFLPAELTPETRDAILERMFQEWLESELNYFIHNQSSESEPLT
jgi:parvulin-like peptidyl-prolyl isomerase